MQLIKETAFLHSGGYSPAGSSPEHPSGDPRGDGASPSGHRTSWQLGTVSTDRLQLSLLLPPPATNLNKRWYRTCADRARQVRRAWHCEHWRAAVGRTDGHGLLLRAASTGLQNLHRALAGLPHHTELHPEYIAQAPTVSTSGPFLHWRSGSDTRLAGPNFSNSLIIGTLPDRPHWDFPALAGTYFPL